MTDHDDAEWDQSQSHETKTAWFTRVATTQGNTRKRRVYGKTCSQRRDDTKAMSKLPSQRSRLFHDTGGQDALHSNTSPQWESGGRRSTAPSYARSKSVSTLPISPQQSLATKKSLRRSFSVSDEQKREWSTPGIENLQPNIVSQDDDLPTTPMTRNIARSDEFDDEFLKSRPRKIRNVSQRNAAVLQGSFEGLAKSSERWCSKMSGSRPPPLVNLLTGVDPPTNKSDFLTPTGTSTSIAVSSRKRGVCDTPIDYDLCRSCSPDETMYSGGKLLPYPFLLDHDEPIQGTARDADKSTVTDDNVSVSESEVEVNDQSIDFSFQSCDFQDLLPVQNDDLTLLQPPDPERLAVSNHFEAAVLAGVIQEGPLNEEVASAILQSMPSFGSLKHLISVMQKEKAGSETIQRQARWTVHTKDSWSPERYASFVVWGTSALGFKKSNLGGPRVFLTIDASTGQALLRKLVLAKNVYTETKKDKEKESMANRWSAKKASPPNSRPLFDEASRKSRPKLRDQVRVKGEGSIEIQVLESMGSLAIDEKIKESSASDQSPVGKTFQRQVTLETQASASSWSSLEGIDELPARNAAPRFSGEHHVGGMDLVHLLGHSPKAAPNAASRALSSGRETPQQPRSSSNVQAIERMCVRGACIETPSIKRGSCRDWGNQGGDWGTSKGCSEGIARVLLANLDERLAEEDYDAETFPSSQSSWSLSCTPEAAFAEASCRQVGGVATELVMSDGNDTNEEYMMSQLVPNRRYSSVGSCAFADMKLIEFEELPDIKVSRRKMNSLAKHRRISLHVKGLDPTNSYRLSLRQSFAVASRSTSFLGVEPALPNDTMERCGMALAELEEVSDELSWLPMDTKILSKIFAFLDEGDLLLRTMPVCSRWADVSTEAHAALLFSSIKAQDCDDDDDDNDDESIPPSKSLSSATKSMAKPWKYLVNTFPWACFLSEGAFKRVYKVWNSCAQQEEALSVMDVDLIESTGNINVVGAELAVSALLSSLVRRNVCPNFVLTRRVFNSAFEPPAKHWGCAENKAPKGKEYVPNMKLGRKPPHPKHAAKGRYQYIRMELCSEGDVEEFLKRQPSEMISGDEVKAFLFQMAYSLFAAADRFSLKHYDVKLLNFFLQKMDKTSSDYTVLRYGLGSHVFSIRRPSKRNYIVKLADYGTANVQAESNGQPATIGQFTTLENTPPEFMILGDAATQGHCHDSFGLGLCMLHLCTGHAPYEEILEDVRCPRNLRKKLKRVWEDNSEGGYDVIRSVIMANVVLGDDGQIIDGEPDDVLYDTLYRYLVLFGIPEVKYKVKECGRIWKAISSCLEGTSRRGKGGRTTSVNDSVQYSSDCKKYSLLNGTNPHVMRARKLLHGLEGGLELLQSLVHFDPMMRATASDVLNSTMMMSLREQACNAQSYDPESDHILSYMAYATGK